MEYYEAQVKCDQDSEEADVPGFLHLPIPRNEEENQIYFDLIRIKGNGPRVWLDIVEVEPITSPRSWVYGDGSPVTWFNWAPGEPNNTNATLATVVEMADHDGKWNDHSHWDNARRGFCTYFLPARAENDCTWLHEFED